MRCLISVCILVLVAACGQTSSPSPSSGPVLEGTLEIISLNCLQGLGASVPCQRDDIAVLPAAAELRDRLAAGDTTALLVAIGDTVLPDPRTVHTKAADIAAVELSRTNLEALAAARVDAYVPGHLDLSTGFDDLLDRCARLGIPVLLSNVDAPKHPNVKPWMVVQAGNVKVGLLGVITNTGAHADDEASKSEPNTSSYPGATVVTSLEAVQRLVGELRDQQGVNLVVLLSNVSQKANVRLAAVRGLDVIIGTFDAKFDAGQVVIEENTAIMSSAPGGTQVGQTTLAVRGGNLNFGNLSPAHEIAKQVAAHEALRQEYRARFGSDDPNVWARRVAPGNEADFLHSITKNGENEEFLKLWENWTDSFMDHHAAELLPPRPDHPALAPYAGQGAAIEAALAAARLKPVVVPEGKPLIPQPADCKSCHAAQFSFWQGTAHSRAFEDLKPLQRMHDGTCLACHAAGFDDPSGWIDPRFDGPFGGVTCYQCHQSYAQHSSSVRQVTDPQFVHADIDRMQCAACHTGRWSPDFDKDAVIASVSCPPMRADEPALLLARKAALDAIRNRRDKGVAEARDAYLEGRALLGLGSFEEGHAVLDRYALDNPSDSALCVDIARLLERAGNSSGAIEMLRRFLENHSGEPTANKEYISLLLEARDHAARDPELALTRLNFLIPKDVDESRSVELDFRVLKIDALFATGQPDKGLSLINELTRDHARDPRLMSRISRYVKR